MTQPIQFDLVKDAGAAPIAFCLSKISQYIVELYWNSPHDVDSHAIALIPKLGAEGRQLGGVDLILSTYNPNLVSIDNPDQPRIAGKKGPFRNSSGSLKHLGDVRTGIQLDVTAPDETIIVELDKLEPMVEEVCFFVTSHPPNASRFSEINDVRLVIKDDSGTVLLQANLTNDFDQYDMVQMGSIVKNKQTLAWDFNPVAVGLNGTFNNILAALG